MDVVICVVLLLVFLIIVSDVITYKVTGNSNIIKDIDLSEKNMYKYVETEKGNRWWIVSDVERTVISTVPLSILFKYDVFKIDENLSLSGLTWRFSNATKKIDNKIKELMKEND